MSIPPPKHDGPVVNWDMIYVPHNDTTITNFRYINKTGEAGYYILWNAKGPDGQPDTFNRTITDIQDRVQKRLEQPEFQTLLQKSPWSREDREAWEEKLSEAVKEEVAATPGFKNYRTTPGTNIPGVDNNADEIFLLNDLNSDLENSDTNTETEKMRLDCGVESAIKGSIIQRIEDNNLPKTAHAGDYKKASSYFMAGGEFEQFGSIGAHSYILSSATGNIIEATANNRDQNAYKKVATPGGFAAYLDHPVVTENGEVYGTPMRDPGQENQAFREADAVLNQNREWMDTHYSEKDLIEGLKTETGASWAKDPKTGLLISTQVFKTDQGYYEYQITVWKKTENGSDRNLEMIGAQDSGGGAPGTPTGKTDMVCKDKEGHEYRIQATLQDPQTMQVIIAQKDARSHAFKFVSAQTVPRINIPEALPSASAAATAAPPMPKGIDAPAFADWQTVLGPVFAGAAAPVVAGPASSPAAPVAAVAPVTRDKNAPGQG